MSAVVGGGSHRGWGTNLHSLSVSKGDHHCEAEQRARWFLFGARTRNRDTCEIERTRVEISASDCEQVLKCIRSALPSEDAGRDETPPGTDGPTYVIEWSAADGYRARLMYELPSCLPDSAVRLW